MGHEPQEKNPKANAVRILNNSHCQDGEEEGTIN